MCESDLDAMRVVSFGMTRETTNLILNMIDDGTLDARTIARDLLGYLSEDEVRDFAHRNDLPNMDEYEEPPEHDDHFANDMEADADALRSAGMGTDEDYGQFGDSDLGGEF